MRPADSADNRLQIDITAGLGRHPAIEGLRRLKLRLMRRVELERPLDDFGNRAVFALRQPVCEVFGAGTADGKL